MTAPAFLLLLGLAGGVENGSLAPWPGFLMMALCLAVFGISIAKINRREQTNHAERKSAQHGGNHARRIHRTKPQREYHKTPEGQGLFQAATALECLGIELGQTRQLVGLLVENLEQEGTDTMQPERVKVYSDCLWVLFDRLRTLEDVAQSEAAHTYGS